MRGRTLPILVAGLTAGCTVGPNYIRPNTSAPASYRAPTPLPPDQAAEFITGEIKKYHDIIVNAAIPQIE